MLRTLAEGNFPPLTVRSMIHSMTGFGRGEAEAGGFRFLAEIKSVNHRFLNTNIRLPREFSHLESFVAGHCAARCERGHLAVTVEMEPAERSGQEAPRLNRDVLDRLLEIAGGLEGLPGVRSGISIESLLDVPGILVWEPEISLDEGTFRAGAERAVKAALEGVLESRRAEGSALERDFRERIGTLRDLHQRISALAPQREDRERERIRAKVRSLLDGSDPDVLDQRVAQEIVVLADRLDVSEELTRMRAHLDHFEAELEGDGGAVGRKLTFFLQEMGREVNTIAAKANDAEMQRLAIEAKAELEKMREQAENVE